MMRLSTNGLSLIKEFEGCKLEAYRCTRGRWTIGWGHTGDDVGPGVRWTQAKADGTLALDVRWVEEAVNELVRVPLTQNQFDALCAFVFNIGRSQFAQSTLLRKVNARDFVGAKVQFSRWNKTTVGGKLIVDRGLTRRRRAEADLFGA